MVAPPNPQATGEHVHRALAPVVVMRARLCPRRNPEHTHVDVQRAGRRLGDLSAAHDAPRHLAAGPRLDDPHGASLSLLARRDLDLKRPLLSRGMVDLKRRVLDSEPPLEHTLDVEASLLASSGQ